MEEIKIGKSYKILIDGFKISGIDFTKLIRIEFQKNLKDEQTYQLEIFGEYQINRFGMKDKFEVGNLEGYKTLLDFTGEVVKLCETDKHGNLWLETQNGHSINIEDGPFENWQFKIYKSSLKITNKVTLIGGIGRVVMF